MASDPANDFMSSFLNSEGHRRTLLDKDWTRVGVGFAVSENGNIYCTQEFGL